jgi:hypothetical protein
VVAENDGSLTFADTDVGVAYTGACDGGGEALKLKGRSAYAPASMVIQQVKMLPPELTMPEGCVFVECRYRYSCWRPPEPVDLLVLMSILIEGYWRGVDGLSQRGW